MHISGKTGLLFQLLQRSLGCVQMIGYMMAWKPYAPDVPYVLRIDDESNSFFYRSNE